ncbi:MAG: MMPL family transporter [Deltaproteobacteria bacterium]|nr:MMPL family transporter [Deltaproteobacteria bacterium]
MNQKNRQRIEAFFSGLARLLYRHRIKTLFLTIAFIAFLSAFIPQTEIDTSAVALLRETDPARIRYNEFREQFDENDIILIAVTPPEVFDTGFLARLKKFHNDLKKEVPYIKRITSLINARDTYGKNDELIVGELLETWPESKSDLERLRKRAFANPFYANSLLSEDGKVTTILLETEATISTIEEDDLLAGFEEETEAEVTTADVENETAQPRYFSEKENRQVVAAINKVVKEYNQPGFAVSVAGEPVVMDVYNRAMERDIVIVITLSLLTIAVFLGILFRRVSGVLIPEIVIISGLLSTAGLLSFFNVTIKLATIVLPGFLLAVSVGYAVHILAIFYVKYQGGRSKEDAIAYAVGHSGLAVVLTAVTTAASLFSFSFAELTSIADLGFFGASGVLLAMVYTFLLLPACISLSPIKRKAVTREGKKSAVMDRILLSFSNVSTRHPRKIVAGSLLLFAVSIYYTCQISYSHNVLNWIADKEQIKSDVPFIDEHLKGSVILEVILDTQKDNGVKDPALLRGIEKLTADLLTYSTEHLYVGKVFSINDIIKETHRSLHNNDPRYYRLPEDRNTISQELLLFENSGSEDLERVVDGNYRMVRVSVKTSWSDAMHLKELVAFVQDRSQKDLPGVSSVTVTGIPAILSRSIPASLHSMAKSYVIAFFVITFLMILHVGNVRIGLLSMISNLLPIFMTMGIMGFFSIKIEMSTIMIGSIAIGIVVDDTLHFMYNFRKYYEDSGDTALAIRKTMLGTGRALLLTSLILSSGFFILMTASLSLLVVFGFLTGLTIIFALLADFFVNPALMVLVTGHVAQAFNLKTHKQYVSSKNATVPGKLKANIVSCSEKP